MSEKKDRRETEEKGRRRATDSSSREAAKERKNLRSDKAEPVREKQKQEDREEGRRDKRDSSRMIHQLMPYFLVVLAIFVAACFLLSSDMLSVDTQKGVGILGEGLRNLLCGLFGWTETQGSSRLQRIFWSV